MLFVSSTFLCPTLFLYFSPYNPLFHDLVFDLSLQPFFLSIFSPWDDDVWPWLGVPVCVVDLRVAMGVGFGFVVWLWWVQIWDVDGGRFSLFLSILILFPLFYLFRQNPFAYCLIICWLRLGFFFFGYRIRICGYVEDNGF